VTGVLDGYVNFGGTIENVSEDAVRLLPFKEVESTVCVDGSLISASGEDLFLKLIREECCIPPVMEDTPVVLQKGESYTVPPFRFPCNLPSNSYRAVIYFDSSQVIGAKNQVPVFLKTEVIVSARERLLDITVRPLRKMFLREEVPIGGAFEIRIQNVSDSLVTVAAGSLILNYVNLPLPEKAVSLSPGESFEIVPEAGIEGALVLNADRSSKVIRSEMGEQFWVMASVKITSPVQGSERSDPVGIPVFYREIEVWNNNGQHSRSDD
jgi:hypothetical protein